MSLTLTSPALTEGGEIPARYTCEGDDISPPLAGQRTGWHTELGADRR